MVHVLRSMFSCFCFVSVVSYPTGRADVSPVPYEPRLE